MSRDVPSLPEYFRGAAHIHDVLMPREIEKARLELAHRRLAPQTREHGLVIIELSGIERIVFDFHVVTPARASARRTSLRTLPVAVRGKLGSTSSASGIFWRAHPRSLMKRPSSSSGKAAPAFNTRQAQTASPVRSLGTETTAISAIAGCSPRASSISFELIFSPARMMRSFLRPVITRCSVPTRRPRSPVLKNPSAVKTDSLSSALL